MEYLRTEGVKADAVKVTFQRPLWQPIETAPKDHPVIVYAPAREGLNELVCICQWHDDAGFTVCELRAVTHWMPLERPE